MKRQNIFLVLARNFAPASISLVLRVVLRIVMRAKNQFRMMGMID